MELTEGFERSIVNRKPGSRDQPFVGFPRRKKKVKHPKRQSLEGWLGELVFVLAGFHPSRKGNCCVSTCRKQLRHPGPSDARQPQPTLTAGGDPIRARPIRLWSWFRFFCGGMFVVDCLIAIASAADGSYVPFNLPFNAVGSTSRSGCPSPP